jgi:hypothetical protein
MNPIRGTLVGGIIGAAVFVVVGAILRFMVKHWIVSTLVIGSITVAYKYGPTGQEHRAAEQVMKGVPTEEQVAEAEERGEEAKPEPKIVAANPVFIRSSSPVWGSTGVRIAAVEIDVSNTGPFAVDDIGLTCYYRRLGDDPRDPPYYVKADSPYFHVLKPGETIRARFGLSDVQHKDILGESVSCTPWYVRLNAESTAKAAGREPMTSLLDAVIVTTDLLVRENRRNYTKIVASGTITNRSKDRYVRDVQIECQITKTLILTETGREWYTVKIEVGPGETKTFHSKDLEQFEPIHGQTSTSRCRLDTAFEEKAEARAERLAVEKAEAEKLARMTPLERKRYREITGTPWGRVWSLWR